MNECKAFIDFPNLPAFTVRLLKLIANQSHYRTIQLWPIFRLIVVFLGWCRPGGRWHNQFASILTLFSDILNKFPDSFDTTLESLGATFWIWGIWIWSGRWRLLFRPTVFYLQVVFHLFLDFDNFNSIKIKYQSKQQIRVIIKINKKKYKLNDQLTSLSKTLAMTSTSNVPKLCSDFCCSSDEHKFCRVSACTYWIIFFIKPERKMFGIIILL